jgi:hypothetical protein
MPMVTFWMRGFFGDVLQRVGCRDAVGRSLSEIMQNCELPERMLRAEMEKQAKRVIGAGNVNRNGDARLRGPNDVR